MDVSGSERISCYGDREFVSGIAKHKKKKKKKMKKEMKKIKRKKKEEKIITKSGK